jgi:dTMP kinase
MNETQAQKKGIFIVLDGIDGSGKGTQTKLLVDRLKMEGFDVETISFPQYGKKSAGAVEEYLNSNYGMIDAKQASVLYAVDRFDASFQINNWLNNGKVVITNRYVTASAGHQGGKIAEKEDREKFFSWLHELEYGLFKIPVPDTNIIIHMPAETAQKLVDQKQSAERAYAEGKKRDLHEADINHLKHAEEVFLEIAETFPNTKIVYSVDGHGRLRSPKEVHTMIWEILTPQLNSIKK